MAVSDEQGGFAFPLVVLENTDTLISEIVEIVRENGVAEVVVGESRDFNMKENDIMKEITPFVESLKSATGLSVHLHPEFLTSLEAEQLQGHNEMHDASAAAIILKSYLETRKNSL